MLIDDVRRREQTRGRETPRYAPPRIFSETCTRSGQVHQISLTADRLHVRALEGGRLSRSFRFTENDLDGLQRAHDFAHSEDVMRNVLRIQTRIPNLAIEVGGGAKCVCMRFIVSGVPSNTALRLEGEELEALALAVSEFRKATAAKAAFEKETSNDEFR